MFCARDRQAGWKMPTTFTLTSGFTYVLFKPYFAEIKGGVFILIA